MRQILRTSLATALGFGAAVVARRVLASIAPRQEPSPSRSEPAPTETILQQFTRTRAADGTQSVHATLLAEFAAGDRITSLHVAFCPPFDRLPDVETETIDDSGATAKLTQLLHNGAQIEVRLPTAVPAARFATVEFFATEPST